MQDLYWRNARFNPASTAVFVDLGDRIPLDLWRQYGFVLATFDLTRDDDAFDLTWTLVCDILKQGEALTRLSVVGTKRDLVPKDTLTTALLLHQRAREVAYRRPGLKLFAVSSVTTLGYSELVRHVGAFSAATR